MKMEKDIKYLSILSSSWLLRNLNCSRLQTASMLLKVWKTSKPTVTKKRERKNDENDKPVPRIGSNSNTCLSEISLGNFSYISCPIIKRSRVNEHNEIYNKHRHVHMYRCTNLLAIVTFSMN